MSAMASQTTSVSMVCSTVCSGANQKNHQSSVGLAFVRGIHRSPVNSPHKRPVTRKCSHLMTSSWYIGFLMDSCSPAFGNRISPVPVNWSNVSVFNHKNIKRGTFIRWNVIADTGADTGALLTLWHEKAITVNWPLIHKHDDLMTWK